VKKEKALLAWTLRPKIEPLYNATNDQHRRFKFTIPRICRARLKKETIKRKNAG